MYNLCRHMASLLGTESMNSAKLHKFVVSVLPLSTLIIQLTVDNCLDKFG